MKKLLGIKTHDSEIIGFSDVSVDVKSDHGASADVKTDDGELDVMKTGEIVGASADVKTDSGESSGVKIDEVADASADADESNGVLDYSIELKIVVVFAIGIGLFSVFYAVKN